MRNNALLWIVFAFIMLISTAYAACAFDYFTYRMNFPPGTSKYHLQQINFTGNLTIILPTGFTFINSSPLATQSGNNYSWETSANLTLNYTIQSPNNCTEGSIYKSNIYHNSTFIDEFIYVCISDEKIVDYKVEYGHGCGNYLAKDEPYISDEPATLFNLVRVWNIGSYLDPDEDALNADITCFYENYPVRTYGRVDVGYDEDSINGSFHWDRLYGGYWFRIGVMSQDVSGKSVGDNYSVNCTELTYDFKHERVVASFPNYSLEVRSIEPLIKNVTQFGSKEVVTIKNNEKYPIYSLVLNFIADGYVETNHIQILYPGETVTYYADTGTNATVEFIPSWYRHCFSPEYYTQVLTNITSPVQNNPPTAANIPSQAWQQNTSNDNAFDLDNYFSDPENDTLTFNYTGPVNINITIDPATHEVSFSQPSNWTGIEYVVFSASDGTSTTYSNNVTLVVYPKNATYVTEVIERGGGKTRRIYVYVPIEPEAECREIWVCSEWSECHPEWFKNRTCEDINKCSTTLFKPETSEECLVEEEAKPVVEEPKELPAPECRLCTIIPFILLLLLIIFIILSWPKDKKQKNEV